MKAIFLLCFGIFFTAGLVCQTLPQIPTPDALEAYLIKHQRVGPHKYEGFRLGGDIFRTKDSVFVSDIIYGDFDQDGDKDLFAVGKSTYRRNKRKSFYYEMFFLITEKNRYQKIEVPISFALWHSQETTCFPVKKVIDGNEMIELAFARVENYQQELIEETDTLTIDAGLPGLFSLRPEKLDIEKITFETTYCYGTCPVYRLEISKKGKVDYKGIAHVTKKGNAAYELDREDQQYLYKLLQHLKPSQLKNQYSVNWTDSQTAKLTIQLADGRSLFVRDYGMKGTFGLTLLYDFFDGLVKDL